MPSRFFATALLVVLLFGCAALSVPEPEQLTTDEDYFIRAMRLFADKNYFNAIPAFEELRDKFPLSPYAVIAELRLGDSHFYKKEYIEAIHYFENFRRLHPTNQHVAYSIYMAGMCSYNQILSPDRDQTMAREAAEQFKQLLELYPTNVYAGMALCKLSEVHKRIAEHEFFIGCFYLKKKNFKGAIERFNYIMTEYPCALARDKLLFFLGRATLLSAEKEKGEKILNLLIRRYPDSPYRLQAQALLGRPLPPEEASRQEAHAAGSHKKKFFLF